MSLRPLRGWRVTVPPVAEAAGVLSQKGGIGAGSMRRGLLKPPPAVLLCGKTALTMPRADVRASFVSPKQRGRSLLVATADPGHDMVRSASRTTPIRSLHRRFCPDLQSSLGRSLRSGFVLAVGLLMLLGRLVYAARLSAASANVRVPLCCQQLLDQIPNADVQLQWVFWTAKPTMLRLQPEPSGAARFDG